ncbi:MAG TPA: 16S rRNA (guanine(966)-N(2))-methyltransferase RsmD [Desulfomicrobiaceae bacterium]|nr:16S rRNA (guanine(966)-N(2))-methyltransferase RsmD [Desulfomicrobiaceae bacterium]
MRIISGRFGGRVLRTTSGPGYRPATGRVRESLFSMLEARGICWSETRVIDIFAGSGSLGIECLSRGAPQAWFVEKSPRAAGLIRRNLQELGARSSEYEVVTRDLFTFLASPPSVRFQLAFLDPPYGRNLLKPAVDRLLETGLVNDDALICAEVEKSVEPIIPKETGTVQLELLRDKIYGQTRIYLWKTTRNA